MITMCTCTTQTSGTWLRMKYSIPICFTSFTHGYPFVCECYRMTLLGRDSRSLSGHSFSVRGQLVLPGLTLSRCCGRCACVFALSRVIAMCQDAWPSPFWGICRFVRVCVLHEWPCLLAVLTSPFLSWLVFRTRSSLHAWSVCLCTMLELLPIIHYILPMCGPNSHKNSSLNRDLKI